MLLPGCHRASKRTAAPAPVIAPIVLPPLARLRPTPRLFEYTRHAPRQVALTFDAGSDDSAVRPLLAQLQKRRIRATFFLTGRFCEEYPDSCRAIAGAGMEIGNHSYSHPRFTKQNEKAIAAQLDRAEQAIVKACGRGAKPLFRFPFGDCNKRVRGVVARAGYQSVGWTLDSLDSVGKPKSAAFVARRIVSKIKPGYIVLMHVSYPHSAEALPRIFAHLDKQGIQAVPVSELLLAAPPIPPVPTAKPILTQSAQSKPSQRRF
jgi:peptidoglycan/xylan/chitin deacetylase (PgdA/CDA1 family)